MFGLRIIIECVMNEVCLMAGGRPNICNQSDKKGAPREILRIDYKMKRKPEIITYVWQFLVCQGAEISTWNNRLSLPCPDSDSGAMATVFQRGGGEREAGSAPPWK